MKNATRHYCSARCMANHRLGRPQATRYQPTLGDHLKDAGEIVVGVVVLAVLIIGLPFLLWLIAGGLR